MKTKAGFKFLIICLIVAIAAGCGGTSEKKAGLSDWDYASPITEPITVISDKRDVMAGDLSTDHVNIVIPAGTVDAPTELTVSNPEAVPEINTGEFEPLGAPIKISAGNPVRLNEPTSITFLIPNNYTEELSSNDIWITYYNGVEWEYFPPDSVNMQACTITFETYHYSLFGKGKIDIEERLKQYTHSQAVSSLIQSSAVDETVNKVVEQVVEHILKDRLGISSESAKFKVLSSLANDDGYKDLIDKFNSGDTAGFMQTLTVFAGARIAENVGESALQGALETLASDEAVGLTAAASQAAGYAAEGQFLEAGRILGEHIADQFLVTQLAKGAIEVVQYQIDTWKDAEINAAYTAYKNGADAKFWGYNVDPGDFESLWNQMRGIATRLQSEAVEREITRRQEYSMRPATDADLDVIRDTVRNDLKKQFEDRVSREGELEKREAKFKALIEKMEQSNLLAPGRFGYSSANDTIETRLDKLFHLSKKILRDTGRQDWGSGSFSDEKEISMGDMVSLMQAWFMSDGPNQYAEMLKDKFGIVPGQMTWALKSATPVIVEVYGDTKDYFNHAFDIVPGLIPNGWQFTSFESWNGNQESYSCYVSMIGGWASPPASISSGETIDIQVKLVPGWEISSRCGSIDSGVSISMRFNGQEIGNASWNRSMSSDNLNDGDSLGVFESTINYSIPTDFKEDTFNIDAYAVAPGGEGYLRYNFVKQ